MYKEINPANWSSTFIESFWIQDNNKNRNINILPDGCVDIIFSFKNNKCKSFVNGCMTKASPVNVESGEVMCGIRFKPGYAPLFLNISMNEITDKRCVLSDIINFDKQITASNRLISNKDQIKILLENSLKKIYSEKYFDNRIFGAISLITQSKGLLSIEDIAYESNISKRQLERKFQFYIGISPKLYSQIIRFQEVHKSLRQLKNDSLALLALDAGYFDQAHFCREYKKFSGLTPSQTIMSH